MRPLRFLPLLLCLMLGGCLKNESTLKFDLPGNINTPYRIVYYASSKKQGMIWETAAPLTNGKGELKIPMRYPAIVYMFNPSQNTPDLMFYAERGDEILIKGTDADMRGWSVTGNELTDRWTEWRLANKQMLSSPTPETLNKAVAQYVEKHPGDDLSLVLLMVYYSRREDEAGFRKLYGKIWDKVLDNRELVGALSAADLMEGPLAEPKIPASLALLGESGYADTLQLKDSVPSLLLFIGKDGMDMAVKDSLPNLISKSPDGRIAEVYMYPDSLGWRQHIRADSIQGLRRMMMPMSLADSTAVSMGVERLPFYLSIGKNGKILYRGDNWKKAVETYKNNR